MTELNLDRRTALKIGAATAAMAGTSLAWSSTAADAATGAFRHGVASGDPLPGAVVLWTRVTPTEEAQAGSGRGPEVAVQWQVATDAAFLDIVRQGSFVTGPGRDHTVKVDADGLRPATEYYYRFLFGAESSRTGRTRTAPAPTAAPARLRLGVVSCSNLQAGWFSAYRHLAARDDLDAVLHLGDYLYEYAVGEFANGNDNAVVRPHVPAHEMVTLMDYRQRHAQYKQDPDLQALHARVPFITTWDDHETTNDRWKAGAENHDPSEGDFFARAAWAYRAYDEWMPVRLSETTALDDGNRIYRRLQFGTLAELTLLDLRTYRDQQVAATIPTPVGPTLDPATADPDRTIVGAEQMAYLKDSLSSGRAQWKLIGNPVMITPVNYLGLPLLTQQAISQLTGSTVPEGMIYNPDQWDGYTADRREIVDHITRNKVKDTVFLTGDIHSAWACDVPGDPSLYPLLNPSVAVEFVCTSVTSNNLDDLLGTPPRTATVLVENTIKTLNRHVKHLNFDDHGYSVLDVTPERVQMDFYTIGDRRDRSAGVRWATSYRTVRGSAKVARVAAPVS